MPRGRPRKIPLPPTPIDGAIPVESHVAVADPPPEIYVGKAKQGANIDAQIAKIQFEETEREWRRVEFAKDVAKQRWNVAQYVHLLKDGVSHLDFNTHPFQREIYQDAALDLLIYGSAQWGKAVRRGTKVLTPRGWVEIQNLKFGDTVTAPDGSPTKVMGVFPQGVLQLYRVTFRDGRSIEACAEHNWKVSCLEWGGSRKLTTADIKSLLSPTREISVPVPAILEAKGIDPRILSIEPTVEDEAVCIAVDHPDHLFVAEGFVVTSNTEFLICDMAVSAGTGLKILFVTSTMQKRNAFVTGRLDPCFGTVSMYAGAMEAAAARNAKADSTQLKHFGPGQIDLIYSSAASQFTSRDADKALIDEHQECDINNIRMVDHRMLGSWYRGIIRVGHPSTAGTEINQNLDYLYQHSDRRLWKVPCLNCKKLQQLTWWNHIIKEERHRGGILSVQPRDKEYKPGGKFDMRPICEECHRPMNRLHKEGIWEAQNPGQRRHGYKLSNLYNINVRLDEMLTRYNAARHSAADMQEFVNKELGEPWDLDGSKITESMLANCADGVGGIDPYRFIPAIHMQWRKETA